MIGKKVVTNIVNTDVFAVGAAESLSGKTGTVTEYNEQNGKYLVEFDTPAEKWWTNQLPVRQFWFKRLDLRKEV